MKRLLTAIAVVVCLLFCSPKAQAAEISGSECVVGYTGFSTLTRLFDGRTMESAKIRKGGTITLAHDSGIASVYLVFGTEYGEFTVTDTETGETKTAGETGYLHEFADLEALFGYVPAQVTLSFDRTDVQLAELSVFTPGQIPDWVQRWAPPAEGEADLVLFSTHGDDEQLFFAGMLPYYGGELGYNVQVVYMTDHRNMTVRRCHEMLDGLWAVGVRHYPVFGSFGDYNSQSLSDAYRIYSQKGISREDILAYVVENIRRFRPKVAVGHDLRGEYGHGMHMIYAELLCQAVQIAADETWFAESARLYGLWDVPKTYLHLYRDSQITVNWDIPLERFGGMTAYEVTKKLGFPCHVSQQTYYSWYFEGKDTAAAITECSPCEFGLYRSTVGEDVLKNDFFENVTTYAQDTLAQAQLREEIARLEAEKESLEMEAPEQPESPATEKIDAEPEPTKSALREIIYKIRKFLGFAQ